MLQRGLLTSKDCMGGIIHGIMDLMPKPMKIRKSHLAIYGNIKILRGYCWVCRSNALVFDGKLQCCDKLFVVEPKVSVRMSNPEAFRKRLPRKIKKEILNLQKNRCLYCSREFGSPYIKNGETKELRIHFDHLIPFSYSQNNYPYNFVAACHRCNLTKSDLTFQTIEECRLYLLNKMEEGWIL